MKPRAQGDRGNGTTEKDYHIPPQPSPARECDLMAYTDDNNKSLTP